MVRMNLYKMQRYWIIYDPQYKVLWSKDRQQFTQKKNIDLSSRLWKL